MTEVLDLPQILSDWDEDALAALTGVELSGMSTRPVRDVHRADRYLGVPVERVQEVLRAQPITPVPLAHEHIGGLLNLRGQIVTALTCARAWACRRARPTRRRPT